MSAKNSAEAVCHMMRTTNCHRVVTQSSLSAITSAVKATFEKEGYSVEFSELPSLQEVFPYFAPTSARNNTVVTPYPVSKRTRSLDDPAIYIHSSGSTGLPKSILWTERIFLQWADTCKCCNMPTHYHLTKS